MRIIEQSVCPSCGYPEIHYCQDENASESYHCQACKWYFDDLQYVTVFPVINFCGSIRIHTYVYDKFTECKLYDVNYVFITKYIFNNQTSINNGYAIDSKEAILDCANAAIAFMEDDLEREELEDDFLYYLDYNSTNCAYHIREEFEYSSIDKKQMNINELL